MRLPDFIEFDAFNEMRKKMQTDSLGYFELFNPELHLTGEERSDLENNGVPIELDQLQILNDQSLVYKNTRLLVYIVEEKWINQVNLSGLSLMVRKQ